MNHFLVVMLDSLVHGTEMGADQDNHHVQILGVKT